MSFQGTGFGRLLLLGAGWTKGRLLILRAGSVRLLSARTAPTAAVDSTTASGSADRTLEHPTWALSGLGGVDKFEPVSDRGDMDHAEEAVGKLVVSGSDGTVELEMAEHALDAVALLVERPVMLDFHAPV